jgi:hypothetical protein
LGERAQQVERTVRNQQERAATVRGILLKKKSESADVRRHLLDLKEKNVQLARHLDEWRVYKSKMERYWQGLSRQLSSQFPVEEVVSTTNELKEGIIKVKRKGIQGVTMCYVGDEIFKAEQAALKELAGEMDV